MFASTNRTIIKKRLLHYLVVMLFTKHFQLKDTPAIQRLLYLMPLPISLVPIKMYSILADAVMEVCSQLQALPQSKTSFVDSADAFDNCISITQNCTAKLSISIMGFVSKEQPELTMSVQTTLALLSKEK